MWHQKVNGMAKQIATLTNDLGNVEDAVECARKLNQDRYDSSELAEGEKRGRALAAAEVHD